MIFPYDFGFIPSTKADDGDPVDILLLLEDSVPMGCVIRTRVIGAVEAEESEDGKKWVRNDRLIGVVTHAHLHENLDNLKTLNPNVLDEIEAFFEQYGGQAIPAHGSGRPQAGPETYRGMSGEVREEIAPGAQFPCRPGGSTVQPYEAICGVRTDAARVPDRRQASRGVDVSASRRSGRDSCLTCSGLPLDRSPLRQDCLL